MNSGNYIQVIKTGARCLLFLLLIQCQQHIKSDQQFYDWLIEKEHGLIQYKKSEGLLLSAMYLPPEYLALKELKSFKIKTRSLFDSLVELNRNHFTFLLVIQADQEESARQLEEYRSVKEYLDDKERIAELYHVAQHLRLHTGTKTLKPSISVIETRLGSQLYWALQLAFSENVPWEEVLEGQTIDLAFNDEIFHTGIHHFIFKRVAMQAIPTIKLE
ncbi:MAG: hypothetical protein ACPGJS_03510 [Flammeovirgaceae bacterium]